MSSLLMSAKKLYPLFFKNGQWYRDYIGEVLGDKNNIEQREEYIKKIYEIVLNSSKSNDVIRKWITTPLSIQDVARVMKYSESAVKSRLYYFNNTVGAALTVKGEDVLKNCVLNENPDWELLDHILDEFYSNIGRRLTIGTALIQKKDMLIHIPRRAPVHKDVSDKEFNNYLKLLADYFMASRKKRQQQIDKSLLNGYFWYLVSGDSNLSAEEIDRRNKILKLAGKDIPIDDVYVEKKQTDSISNDDEIIDWGFDDKGIKTTYVKVTDW